MEGFGIREWFNYNGTIFAGFFKRAYSGWRPYMQNAENEFLLDGHSGGEMEKVDESELVDVDRVLEPTDTCYYVELSHRQALLEVVGEGGLGASVMGTFEKDMQTPSLGAMERAQRAEFERIFIAID